MILLYFIFLKTVSCQNSSNITNSSHSNDLKSNEISYGIFTFLFALFALFLLIGIFFLIERFICKKKSIIQDFYRALLRSMDIFKKRRRIKPKPKKKRLNNLGSVVNNKET